MAGESELPNIFYPNPFHVIMLILKTGINQSVREKWGSSPEPRGGWAGCGAARFRTFSRCQLFGCSEVATTAAAPGSAEPGAGRRGRRAASRAAKAGAPRPFRAGSGRVKAREQKELRPRRPQPPAYGNTTQNSSSAPTAALLGSKRSREWAGWVGGREGGAHPPPARIRPHKSRSNGLLPHQRPGLAQRSPFLRVLATSPATVSQS